MTTQLAQRNVKVDDPALMGLKGVTLTFTCQECGKEGTQRITEVYAHFPQRRKGDNIVASFALPSMMSKGLICMECVLK